MAQHAMPRHRVAIVTGAARGIGAATAQRLARDGVAVGVVDPDEVACLETVTAITDAGGHAIGAGADVTDPKAVRVAVSRVAHTLGPPNILVNNAGIVRNAPFARLSDTDWDDVIEVHLRGAFNLAREVHPHLIKQGWGRIVNVSSQSALGSDGQASYSAAKAGLQGLTRTLAIELGPSGVTVNAVAPGFIVTDTTAAAARYHGVDFEAFQRAAAESIPVRRVGQPEDVASAIAYLVGDEASFVNGQILYITGGPAG